MTERPRLNDALIKEALSRRAAGPNTPAELVVDVRAAVETVPQGLGWRWRIGPRPRLLPVVVLTLLLLAAVVGYALVLGGAVIVPSTESGDIAFVRATYGWSEVYGVTVADRRIYSVDAHDGGRPTLQAEVPGLELPQFEGQLALRHGRSGPGLQWSPDGTHIAFRLFNDAAGLYVMNRDGSELSRLVALPYDVNTDGFALHTSRGPIAAGFAWSPDGEQIALSYPYFGSSSPVYVVDVGTGTFRNVTGERLIRGATGTVAWSPDGSRIAFAGFDGESRTYLVVMNSDGSGEHPVFQAESDNSHVVGISWSPDGALIGFVRVAVDPASNSGSTEIALVDADGNGLRRLVGPWPSGCCGVGPTEPLAWSPDGRRLAFNGEDGAIWIASVDETANSKLAYGETPAWSPDGSQLVFSRSGSPIPGAPSRVPLQHSIYLIDADGSGYRWLADGEYPVWAPASGDAD
jgi:Tol biopolymer transport system component